MQSALLPPSRACGASLQGLTAVVTPSMIGRQVVQLRTHNREKIWPRVRQLAWRMMIATHLLCATGVAAHIGRGAYSTFNDNMDATAMQSASSHRAGQAQSDCHRRINLPSNMHGVELYWPAWDEHVGSMEFSCIGQHGTNMLAAWYFCRIG